AVVLVAPLVLLARPLRRRRRLALLAVSGAACAAVLAPWTGYNLARFEEPELISSGLGPTLLVSNCPQTYTEPFKGWWWYPCITGRPLPPGDASRRDLEYRRIAGAFVAAHRDELPGVVLARLGRIWGFYHPLQQITLDTIESRELGVSRVGLGLFYVLAAASAAGVVVLRRRRVPVLPLLAFPVVVSVAVAAFYGTTRFRAAAEPSLVLLAVVALDAVLPRRRPHPPPGDPPVERPASRPAPAVT
ncbi:MAG TPA: glycosyl transferase, partial [Frankiaceae bacterium]|nr:glycosyl transferase [Frankiaceae bacterium]